MNAQTSNYHPFPKANATWNIESWDDDILNPCLQQYSIMISGDTTIHDTLYHKLYIPYVLHDNSNTSYCILRGKGYLGAIREDAVARKLYYIHSYKDSEELLCDFSLNVGDTITGIMNLGAYRYNYDTIISIDSVKVNGVFHKRWNVNQEYHVSYIEGVGSTWGLIESFWGTNLIGRFPNYKLNCFSLNDQPLYPENESTCSIITTTNNHKLTSSYFTINIQYIDNKYTFNFVKNGTFDIEIEIYNLQGNKLFQHKQEHFNTSAFTINTTNFQRGLYLLHIKTPSEVITKKVLIN